MKLNMTIISDYLDSQDIKRKQTNRPFSFYLESVEVCTGERFRESCLYIADAEDLPEDKHSQPGKSSYHGFSFPARTS